MSISIYLFTYTGSNARLEDIHTFKTVICAKDAIHIGYSYCSRYMIFIIVRPIKSNIKYQY